MQQSSTYGARPPNTNLSFGIRVRILVPAIARLSRRSQLVSIRMLVAASLHLAPADVLIIYVCSSFSTDLCVHQRRKFGILAAQGS